MRSLFVKRKHDRADHETHGDAEKSAGDEHGDHG
jgi:hypothetical protein